MVPVGRPYQAEDDYWRMRELLREAFAGGYSPAANALYASVMGDDHERSE